ncbi:anti-sigma factor [Halomonas denitrificans]|nr:anti-sigma factor [Halomonas denitrificans]
MNSKPMNEELLNLLSDRALGELSPADDERLDKLLEAAVLTDEDEIELAVAAAMNAFAVAETSGTETTSGEAPPASLGKKLRADADRYFEPEPAVSTVSRLDEARARHTKNHDRAASRSWTAGIGWAVAAMLAVVVLVTLPQDPVPDGVEPVVDAAAARSTLMAEAGSTVIEWGRSDIPAYNSVTGDVVWNDERQEGYLRLVGMPRNDPAIAQYQLWIVDPDRDANPVDGGVFDIPAGADEIIIPIDAKLDVSQPAAFAITREQPGGVVVSDGPLLIVAAVDEVG